MDRLVREGKVNPSIQRRLEKMRDIDDLLIAVLRTHPDALNREVCAAILGERRSRKAIPALLVALSDRSPHVRLDALWAIEKAVANIGDISVALLLNVEDWPEVRRRMKAWWRAVKDDPYFK
jgi:HEAT repeat protein